MCPYLVTTYSLLSQWRCPACESHKDPGRSQHTLQSFYPSTTLVIQGGIEFDGKLKIQIYLTLKPRLVEYQSRLTQFTFHCGFVVILLLRETLRDFLIQCSNKEKIQKKRFKIAAAGCSRVHSCMNTHGSYCMWNAYK